MSHCYCMMFICFSSEGNTDGPQCNNIRIGETVIIITILCLFSRLKDKFQIFKT